MTPMRASVREPARENGILGAHKENHSEVNSSSLTVIAAVTFTIAADNFVCGAAGLVADMVSVPR